MYRPCISTLGSALGALVLLSGCGSMTPVAAECPRFRPSAEALTPIQGTGWKPLAERVIETYYRP